MPDWSTLTISSTVSRSATAHRQMTGGVDEAPKHNRRPGGGEAKDRAVALEQLRRAATMTALASATKGGSPAGRLPSSGIVRITAINAMTFSSLLNMIAGRARSCSSNVVSAIDGRQFSFDRGSDPSSP